MQKDPQKRIRNLLRLAHGNENEHESQTAMLRAVAIAQRHGLEIDRELGLLDVSAVEPEIEIGQTRLDTGTRTMTTWRALLAAAVGSACHVRTLYAGGTLIWVGQRHDRESSRDLYVALHRWVQVFATRRGRGHGRRWTHAYRQGMVVGLGQRLEQQTVAIAASVANETALALRERSTARAIDGYLESYRIGRPRSMRVSSSDGFRSGEIDSREVPIRRHSRD